MNVVELCTNQIVSFWLSVVTAYLVTLFVFFIDSPANTMVSVLIVIIIISIIIIITIHDNYSHRSSHAERSTVSLRVAFNESNSRSICTCSVTFSFALHTVHANKCNAVFHFSQFCFIGSEFSLSRHLRGFCKKAFQEDR